MIKDILGITIYVDDFSTAYDFYAHLLGLEKSSSAGDNACFFRLEGNQNAIYLEGGHERVDVNPNANGVSAMLVVESATRAFLQLSEAGVRMVQDEPQNLGNGNYWFRFYDPAGNILEMVSSD